MRTMMFLLAALVLAACDPVDEDADGWWDGKDNQRVTLMVTGVSAGPLAPAVTIGDRIVFERGLNTPPHVPVQVRTLGVWAGDPDDGAQSFSTVIRVDNVASTVIWSNDNQDFDVTVGQRIISLRSEVTRFADTTLDDAEADLDGDFITDLQESRLSEASGGRIGDPEGKDLLVAVASINEIHDMTRRAREAVSTVFRNRDINLVFMDGTQPITGFTSGQFLFDGTVPDTNANLSRPDIEPSRPNHIPDWADDFTHFMVMAAQARIGGKLYFGAAYKPGFEIVVGSSLPASPPDLHDYQAKTIMHELGHNLGLCHPVQDTDSRCPALPAKDRDPAVSVMGSPAAASNPALWVTQALARPLDYTEAQWAAIVFNGEFP